MLKWVVARTYYQKTKRIDKLSQENKVDLFFDLINAFSTLKTPLDSANFLQDLLSANEVKNLAVRLRIAKLLLKGESYLEIGRLIHCSSATITKVSVWLAKGDAGFKKVISSLPDKISKPAKLPRGPIEYHLPDAILGVVQENIALKQNKLMADFSKKMSNKKNIDAELREMSDERYASRKSL